MVTSIRLIVGIIGSAICIVLYAVPILTFKRKFVILMVSLVLGIFCVAVFVSSFIIHTHHMRKVFVGSIGIVTAMSMYSSPLVAVKQVMRTRSVEFMPFYLSLFSFLTSLIWMVYGILGRDPYITSPNAVGCFTGILQLVVYCIYNRCKEPPGKLRDSEQANDMDVVTSREEANGFRH
nr:unnamed protein product [Digitaria exilis]